MIRTMAHTLDGIALENYVNAEIKNRNIEGVASVIESQGSLDLLVRVRIEGKPLREFTVIGTATSEERGSRVSEELDRI